MLYNVNNIIGIVFNLLTAIFNLFACLISIIVLICIIYHKYSTRIKREEKIILILAANIYIYIFLYDIVQLLLSIYTILGDFYGIYFNSSWCIFNGYFIAVLFSALYYGFVVQAIFRLCRIVYSSYRWLQFYWFYIIVTPIQLVTAFVMISPLLFWNDIVYLPNEYYCFPLFTNIRGVIWLSLNIYIIPLLFLLCIYFHIILFIRQHSNNQSLLVQHRQRRDLLAIQRIFITIKILFILSIPTTVLFILANINGVEHPLTHRITMISYAITTAILSVETVLVTPKLKSVTLKIWQRNQIAPNLPNLTDSVQLRTVAIAR